MEVLKIMMNTMLYICTGLVALLLILNIVFHLWVYIIRRDVDFVMSAWTKRHQMPDKGLSHYQALLLKVISVTERGLGYFGLFVVVPLKILLMFIGR